jgi:hypothetical protein
MEFGVHQFQNIKLGVHIAQVALFAIAWCLCIAVFRSSASVDGRLGWYFGLVSPQHPPRITYGMESNLYYTVLPHNPSNHLPNNDPPLPAHPKVRQPLPYGRCRSRILHTMALGFRSGSELEWDGEVQIWLHAQQSGCCIWSLHLVRFPYSISSLGTFSI